MVGEVFELSRAHEGEVGRVEEDDGPMALQIRIRNLLEGAFVVASVSNGRISVVSRDIGFSLSVDWFGRRHGVSSE